jgi:hypothetical protein
MRSGQQSYGQNNRSGHAGLRTETKGVRPYRSTDRTTGGQGTQGYGQSNRKSGYTGLRTEQQEVRLHRATDRTTGGQATQVYGQKSREFFL